jgi:hypothetical protein
MKSNLIIIYFKIYLTFLVILGQIIIKKYSLSMEDFIINLIIDLFYFIEDFIYFHLIILVITIIQVHFNLFMVSIA